MEMTKYRVLPMCLLGVVLIWCAPLRADSDCYQGGADTGELVFSGVMEGAAFTGRFTEFSVRHCPGGVIEVSVATASATVGHRDGDRTMASEAFFHPQAWPAATWISTAVPTGAHDGAVPGTLTLRGIAREVPVHLVIDAHQDGLRLHGRATMERLDFGVGSGEFEDTRFIGNEVTVRFDLTLAP